MSTSNAETQNNNTQTTTKPGVDEKVITQPPGNQTTKPNIQPTNAAGKIATKSGGQSSGPGTAGKTNISHEDVFGAIFKKSNIVFVFWGLAIYILVTFIMYIVKSPDPNVSSSLTVMRTFDFICLCLLTAALIMWYVNRTDAQRENAVNDGFHAITSYADDATSLFSTGLFIFVFYFSLYILGIPMDYASKPTIISLVETGAWVLFTFALMCLFFHMVLHISLKKLFDTLWEEFWNGKKVDDILPEIQPNATTATAQPTAAPTPAPSKEEVFNIANNLYTYDDAQTICSAYGARLATYDEIEDAYKDGGEWCNYGWSEGQMIFFPTQKTTWDSLQKTKHKNSCGRPGVNGGYIDNPYARFGVNCYGKKPGPKEADIERMKQIGADPVANVPKSEEDQVLEMKVQYWKDHADQLLQINAFNSKKWSEM